MIHLPDPPLQRAVVAVVALQLLLLSAAAAIVALLAWALSRAGASPIALLVFQPAYVVADGAPAPVATAHARTYGTRCSPRCSGMHLEWIPTARRAEGMCGTAPRMPLVQWPATLVSR